MRAVIWSKSVNQHRFLRLSAKDLFTHQIWSLSTRSSDEVAGLDRGDDSEEASLVVLNVGRFGKDLQRGSSTMMGISLKKSLFA